MDHLELDPRSAPPLQRLGPLCPAVLRALEDRGVVAEAPHDVVLRNVGQSGHAGMSYLEKLHAKHPETLLDGGRHLLEVVSGPDYFGLERTRFAVALVRRNALYLPRQSERALHLFAAVKLLRFGTPHVLVTAFGMNDAALNSRIEDGKMQIVEAF